MEKSEDIKELAVALCKVQAGLRPAVKSSTNPFFKSKYADLTSVWESCRQLLAANGLAVVQTCSNMEGADILLDTTLLHTSGQWIGGQLLVTPKSQDPQAVGSALTYARRYSLSAIVGIATEDDDAEDAMSRQAPKEKPKEPKLTPLQRLAKSAKANGYSNEQLSAFLPVKFGVKTSKELTEEQIMELTVMVEGKLPLEVDTTELQPELEKGGE